MKGKPTKAWVLRAETLARQHICRLPEYSQQKKEALSQLRASEKHCGRLCEFWRRRLAAQLSREQSFLFDVFDPEREHPEKADPLVNIAQFVRCL